jgi:YidC/Oxa1 family membrane protein insertase
VTRVTGIAVLVLTAWSFTLTSASAAVGTLKLEPSHATAGATIKATATYPEPTCPVGATVGFFWGKKETPLNPDKPVSFTQSSSGCTATTNVTSPVDDNNPGKYEVNGTDNQGNTYGPVQFTLDEGFLQFLKPVGDVLRFPFQQALGFLYGVFHAIPVVDSIGPYGLAIIVVTIAVKLLLFPLFQTQLKLTKRSQAEQRKIAPELAEIRKRYKKDPQRLNKEMMALYKQHGINPLSPMLGCLPTLAQMPVLIGLYQAIFQAHNYLPHGANAHFLGLDLSVHATTAMPVTWILPLLAGATTFVQSKMFAQPVPANPDPDDQAAQMAKMTSSMSLLMPVLITFFAFQPYALQGLVLYWIIGNIFMIFQQYTVNGWGQLPILGNKPPVDVPPVGRGKDRDKRGAKQLAGAAAGNGRRGRRR